MWVNVLKLTQQSRRKKDRTKERRENEQNSAIDTGPSLRACTHVRTRAYIRGLRSLRQSINTHNATGEAGRRVRVSQRITPPLPLRQSGVSPVLLLQLYICNRSCSYAVFFLREKPRGVRLAGKTPTSSWCETCFLKKMGKQNQAANYTFPKRSQSFSEDPQFSEVCQLYPL